MTVVTVAGVLGPVIVRTRDHAPIAAITPRVGSSDSGRAWAPPMILVDETSTRSDVGSGQGNARLWMQESVILFRCYGVTGPQADQLGRLVWALWHEAHAAGPLELTGGLRVRGSWLAQYAGAVDDPKLKRPMVTVRVRILAAGAPIA